jgi:hypothetical protein
MALKLQSKKRLLLCLITLIGSVPVFVGAQSIKRQSISSYGSSTISDHLLIGQTAGQSFNTTVNSNGIILLQGFQQPQTFVVEEIVEPLAIPLDLSVYPNPANRSITISSKDALEQSFIQVTDVSGKKIFSEKVPDLILHQINCQSWVNGAYFITISDDRKHSKTMKLIISK